MRPRWAKRTAFEKPRTARRRLADQSFQWLPRKVPNPHHLEKINCHTTTQARKTPTGLVLLPPRLVTLPRCQNFGSLHPPNTSIPPDPRTTPTRLPPPPLNHNCPARNLQRGRRRFQPKETGRPHGTGDIRPFQGL